ncbi:MAG: GDSL-type esterase/lipase family protein [Rubrivivax sp.]
MIAIGTAAAVWLLGASGCAVWRIGRSAELAKYSEAFQNRPVAPVLSLLVVGDSTAVGTGASNAPHSLAGLAAADYPRLLIDNRAADGAKFEQVVQQLEGVERRFDLVLVQAGGNDVIRLTDEAALSSQIDRTVALARQRADTVILMPSGNVGSSPFFFAPISWLMTKRSQTLHRLIRNAAAAPGVIYVDLYKPPEDDPFVRQPGMFADDGLHPSDKGYRQWWSELLRQADLRPRLAGAR